MNEGPQGKRTKQKTPLGRQILRIAVWSAVFLFVILVAVELRAKWGAVDTAHAWQNALAESADADLSEEDLAAMVAGSPVVESRTQRPPDELVVTYLWPGVFRDFRVNVVIEESDRPVVMNVSLLGSATELKSRGRKRKTASF